MLYYILKTKLHTSQNVSSTFSVACQSSMLSCDSSPMVKCAYMSDMSEAMIPPPPAILILVSKIFGQCHFQKILFLLIFSDLTSLQNAFDKS